MRGRIGLFLIMAATGSALAAPPLAKVRALRRERKIDRDRFEVAYKFEDEHVKSAVQAGRRGAEAAKAWAALEKGEKAVAVVARSPFGGGETVDSYWPADVKAELLRNVVETLKKAGLEVVLPELPAASGVAETPAKGEDKDSTSADRPAKPWPKIGFSEDHEFVLVIGLHHEPIPHGGARRKVEAEMVRSWPSRVSAWAILFHAPTATAFWGTTASARAGRRGVPDPLNVAAGAALGYLDFTDIGSDNIPEYIRKLAGSEKLKMVDAAAMLAQTQRADAAEAIIKAATAIAAFKNTIPVLRYFSQKGVVQDYRTDPAQAERRRFVLVSQSVMVRILLLEHLRGLYGIQPCASAARVSRMTDIDIPQIGRRRVGRLGPLCGDDEIVLISELANSDPRGIFTSNRVAAVRNLGRCRVHIDEAMTAARFYADRKVRRPRPGRKPRRDRLKEAGAAALIELRQAKANQKTTPLK